MVVLLFAALPFSYCTDSKSAKKFKKIGVNNPININVKLDSISINIENNSGKYFVKIINSKIHFVDRLFGKIKVYDEKSGLIRNYLGKREYPQIGEIYTVSFFDDFYYVTDNLLLYKFDSKFNLLENSRIKFKPNILNFDADNPNPEQIMFYQLNYNAMKSFEGFENSLIIPVEMELPKLNAFNTNNYYKIAFNFALLDTSTFKVKKLFNNWSDPYVVGNNFPFLTRNSYVIANNKIFINHEADSLIYILDNNLEPLYKFGYKPKIFNDKYRKTNKLAEAFDPSLSPAFRKEFGFFKEIVVNKEIVLRSFNTGKTFNKKGKNFGIQIYKNFELVKEIMFEKELEIIGFIDDELYLYDSMILQSENLKIYTLNIQL